jgi:hypothetical protein
MDWPIVILILGIVAIIGVLLVGGTSSANQKGVVVKTDGLLSILLELSKKNASQASAPAELKQTAARINALADPLARTLPRATILWVGDQPLNNLLERRVFAGLGIYCDAYTNNAEALKSLRTSTYDLVLSDIGRGGSPRNRLGSVARCSC